MIQFLLTLPALAFQLARNGHFERAGCHADICTRHSNAPIAPWYISDSVHGTGEYQLITYKSLGHVALHMNNADGPIAVSQFVTTNLGRRYFLEFSLNSRSCGPRTKRIIVRIGDSEGRFSHRRGQGWIDYRVPFDKHVGARRSKLTIKSLTEGSCGAIIDNVRVTIR